jgi:hypothetical protein
VWDPNDALVDGGGGFDTLQVNGAEVVLNLRLIPDGGIVNIERIDLTGSGNNKLTLGFGDVLAISSTTDVLRVEGNAGDIVNAGRGWTHGPDQVIGANTYDTYTQGGATLLVDSSITQDIFA